MTENVGRPPSPSPEIREQYRGHPMYSREEMRRRYPRIRVTGALAAGLRAIAPHDFKNTVNTADDKLNCDLCGKKRLDNPLHFF